MLAFTAVIPARLGSSRLPGKVLLEIGGRPMVRHVYERALASGASAVVVATDDAEVARVCRGFGADVQMTGTHHRSGTERIAEVSEVRSFPADQIVVNVQADEPLLPPRLVRQAAEDLEAWPAAGIATLCTPLSSPAEVFDPNVVKVVLDREGFALYFSRAPIPWHREGFREPAEELPAGVPYLRHIGLYAYRAGVLRRIAAEPPVAIESAESLEQLRALATGVRIHVTPALEPPGVGVDTPEDLERVRAVLPARADPGRGSPDAARGGRARAR